MTLCLQGQIQRRAGDMAFRDTQWCFGVQAYEGLQTAHKLKQEYVFLPAKLKEVYLYYLLEHLEDHKVHTTS